MHPASVHPVIDRLIVHLVFVRRRPSRRPRTSRRRRADRGVRPRGEPVEGSIADPNADRTRESLQQALGKAIRAIGVKEFAARIRMAGPNVLRAIHPRHDPTQATLNRLLEPFGLRLSLAPLQRSRNPQAGDARGIVDVTFGGSRTSSCGWRGGLRRSTPRRFR
jgi:DNA-binding phage protein